MDFSLSEEQKILRDTIVRFASKELNEGMIERDRDQVFARDLWLKCGELRLQGLPVPEEYNGSGLDPLSTAIALEALGYGCHDGGLVFSICAHLLSRSEEHTSELQSQSNLVCRLLLEKKKTKSCRSSSSSKPRHRIFL